MVDSRLPDNQEDREVYLREHNADRFVEAVNHARRESAGTVLMTVEAFASDPQLLYVALDYAYHDGTSATMAPHAERDNNTQRSAA